MRNIIAQFYMDNEDVENIMTGVASNGRLRYVNIAYPYVLQEL
jgi:hypothetical protein